MRVRFCSSHRELAPGRRILDLDHVVGGVAQRRQVRGVRRRPELAKLGAVRPGVPRGARLATDALEVLVPLELGEPRLYRFVLQLRDEVQLLLDRALDDKVA